MQVCIQDPANQATYLLRRSDLDPFSVDPHDDSISVDVVLVHAGDTLVQELPSTRLSDSETPTVQIVMPDESQSWVVKFEDLQAFKVQVPPEDADDVVWFAMPTAKKLMAAVPAFRRAMVQHSS